MAECKHDYRRLNDEAVFCRGCGDIKRAEPAVCTLPHYQPTWIYYPPVYPTVTPWNPAQWWGTTTFRSNTVTFDSEADNVTYTALGGPAR